MKIKFNSLQKTVLVLCLWLACIYKLYIGYDKKYLLDNVLLTLLIIIAGIVSIFVIKSDYSCYKQQKKITSLTSTISIFLCVIGLLLSAYFLKRQDKSPSILYAIKKTEGLGFISLDFRKNNTYKLGEHNFMSAKYTRGQYTKEDSIVYLSKPDNLESFIANKFLIKTIPLSDSIKKRRQNSLSRLLFGKSGIDTTPQTFLFQINDRGEIIDSSKPFEIRDKVPD